MPGRLAGFTLTLVAACLVAACGFQLRGTGSETLVPDAWKSMYLDTDNPNGELSREVRSSFAASGVVWAEEREEATYRLVLGAERFSQRNLSVSADARAAEIELTLSAQFSVQDDRGKRVMPPTQASVVQQMENDPSNVVGKAEELRIIRSEMRVELARQMMRRIGFFAASTAP